MFNSIVSIELIIYYTLLISRFLQNIRKKAYFSVIFSGKPGKPLKNPIMDLRWLTIKQAIFGCFEYNGGGGRPE